ncbi:MAG: hypothetical protein APF84_16430 [Gracilibacter sp. BRH_c7a]|nr:MAG: hypothetical protein APF84_16430 [Gracilibacter sp. BRH_c7a]
MRKLAFMYIILLFALVSCSVNMEPNSNSQDTSPEDSLEENNISPVIMETEKYTTEKVEFSIFGFKRCMSLGLMMKILPLLCLISSYQI